MGTGPDGVDVVDAARLEHLAQLVGDEAVAPVRAVVGADADVAVAAQLVLEDDPLARPAADDAGDLDALRGQPLGEGMDDGRAHAATHADGAASVDELGGPAERPRHVADDVTHREDAEVAARLAHGLDDERDGAGLRVGIGDRQRDALGALVPPDDDELARLADLGDACRPR